MTAVLILMILFSLFCLLVAIGSIWAAWQSVKAFWASEEQKSQYHSFMRAAIEEIQESSAIFRTELVRRMGADIPEVKDLNTLLHTLERQMAWFRHTLDGFLKAEE